MRAIIGSYLMLCLSAFSAQAHSKDEVHSYFLNSSIFASAKQQYRNEIKQRLSEVGIKSEVDSTGFQISEPDSLLFQKSCDRISGACDELYVVRIEFNFAFKSFDMPPKSVTAVVRKNGLTQEMSIIKIMTEREKLELLMVLLR